MLSDFIDSPSDNIISKHISSAARAFGCKWTFFLYWQYEK